MEIDVLQVLDEMDSFRRKCYDKPDAECPTDWALRVAEAILAKAAGYSGRTAWTGDLKQNSASQYAQDLENLGLSFHA